MVPQIVFAHLVITGLGPLFDGLGHVVVTPEDLLPVVALALLAGLGGKPYARTVLFTVAPAWLTGGLLGLMLGWGAPLAVHAAWAMELFGRPNAE